MTLKFKNEEEFKEWQQKAADANPKKASADKTAAPAADVVPAMAPTTAAVNEPKVKTKEDIVGKVQEALRTNSIKSIDSHAKELMTKIVKEFKNTSSDVIEQMHKDEKNLLKEVLDEIAKLEGKNGKAFEAGIKELVQIGAQLEASAKKKGDVAGENLGQKIQEQAKQKLFEEKGIGLTGQEDTAGNRISQALLGKNSPTGIKEGYAFNKETNTYHKKNDDGTQGEAVDRKVAKHSLFSKQGFGERVKGIGATIKEGARAENLFDKGSLARSVFVPHSRERELENEELEKQSKKGEMADIAKDAKGIIDGETPDKEEKSKSDKSASGTGDPSKPIEQLIVAIEKLIVAMDKNSDEKTPGKAEKQKDPTALDKVDAERKDVGKTADRLKAGVNGEDPESLQPRDAKGRFAKKEPTPVNVVKSLGPSTSDKQNMDEARQAEEIKEKTGDTKGILAAETIDAKEGSMIAGPGEKKGGGLLGALADTVAGAGAGLLAGGAGALGLNALRKRNTGKPKLPKGINEKQLLDKNGKPLSGAARNSRIEKLQKAKPAGKPGMFEKIRKGGASLLGKASKGAPAVGAKIGARGIPILGSLIGAGMAGYSEYQESGNLGRAAFAGGGALFGGLAGTAAGALAGSAVAPGVGTVIGGVAGGVAGSIGGEELGKFGYDKLFGKPTPKKPKPPVPGGKPTSMEAESRKRLQEVVALGGPGGPDALAARTARARAAVDLDKKLQFDPNKPGNLPGADSDLFGPQARKNLPNILQTTGANKSGDNIEQTTNAAAPKPPAVIPAAPAAQPAAAQQKNGIPPMIMEKQGVRMNDNSWQRFQDRRAIG